MKIEIVVEVEVLEPTRDPNAAESARLAIQKELRHHLTGDVLSVKLWAHRFPIFGPRVNFESCSGFCARARLESVNRG